MLSPVHLVLLLLGGDQSIPDPQGPARGVAIVTAAWARVGISGVFLALRIYARCWSTGWRTLWVDDVFLTLSWLFMVEQNSFIVKSVAAGFGHRMLTLSAFNLSDISYRWFCVVTFNSISSAFSKTAFALSLQRVTRQVKVLHFILWFIIISVWLSHIVAAIFPFIRCKPMEKIWKPWVEGTCYIERNVQMGYLAFISVYAGIIDVTLALLPVAIVPKMNFNTREQATIAAGMAVGLIAGIFAFVKTHYFLKPIAWDWTREGFNLTFWANAESSATIMSASIPILRVWLRDARRSIAEPAAAARNSKGSKGSNAARGKQASKETTTTTASPTESESTDSTLKDATTTTVTDRDSMMSYQNQGLRDSGIGSSKGGAMTEVLEDVEVDKGDEVDGVDEVVRKVDRERVRRKDSICDAVPIVTISRIDTSGTLLLWSSKEDEEGADIGMGDLGLASSGQNTVSRDAGRML